LTECWIKHVWKFTDEKHIIIQEERTQNMKLRCEKDTFLMENTLEEGNFGPIEIKHINRCRIHSQVTSLADIVTGDSKNFTKSAYHCNKDNDRPDVYH
jgi:hypothetical protein